LAALSQTTMSLIHGERSLNEGDTSRLMKQSRIAVVVWGAALAGAALVLYVIKEIGHIDILSLAFGMVAYTYGPMLGIFLLALAGVPARIQGLWLGVSLSFLLTLLVRPDLYIILRSMKLITEETMEAVRPEISFVWLFPVTCLLTVTCGALMNRIPKSPDQD
jgi:hypothetical protein